MVAGYLWLVGFLLAVSSPDGFVPSGLGASFAALVVTVSVFLVHRRRSTPDREDYLILGSAALLTLSPLINTNEAVVALSVLGWSVGTLLYVLRASTLYPAPDNMFSFFRGVITLFLAILGTLFDGRIYRRLALRRKSTPDEPTKKVNLAPTILVTFILLVTFHTLFAHVNEEYSHFVETFFKEIWEFLLRILDFVLIWKTICFAVLCSGTFQILSESQADVSERAKSGIKKLLLLTPIVLLFGVFSLFQGKLILIDPILLSFKELSLYTQKGFWELLVASFIGYAVWYQIAKSRDPLEEGAKKLQILLFIFLSELIVVSLFTAHKLALLQLFFGLKDTRVLASLAVILIGTTFVLSFLRLLGLLSDGSIFVFQYRAMATVVLVLTFGNLEQFVTNVHPIRHQVNHRWQKDYAYLLGNSLDNYAEWLSITSEATRTGVAFPSEYYWGSYQSICDSGKHSIISSLNGLLNYNASETDFRQFNLRKFAASQFVQIHREEFIRFIDYVEVQCGHRSASCYQ